MVYVPRASSLVCIWIWSLLRILFRNKWGCGSSVLSCISSIPSLYVITSPALLNVEEDA